MASQIKLEGRAPERQAPAQRVVDGAVMEAADPFTSRALRPHLLLSICFLLPLIGIAGVWAATFNVGQMNTVMGNGGIEAYLAPAFAAAAACVLLAWIIVLFRPLRESLADGAIIVEDCAQLAQQMYAAIRDSAANRCQSPFHFQPRDLADIPGVAVRSGAEYGLITVRVVGSDLFIGWSLWRRRSTARLVGQILNNMVDPARINAYSAAAASSFVLMREQLQCIMAAGIKAGASSEN